MISASTEVEVNVIGLMAYGSGNSPVVEVKLPSYRAAFSFSHVVDCELSYKRVSSFRYGTLEAMCRHTVRRRLNKTDIDVKMVVRASTI